MMRALRATSTALRWMLLAGAAAVSVVFHATAEDRLASVPFARATLERQMLLRAKLAGLESTIGRATQ